jgi:surfeit locus 1 family protein
MTSRTRIPIFATLVVLAAIATMIGLGVWQLQRAAWKEGVLTRFHAAERDTTPVPFPMDAAAREAALYRHSSLTCDHVTGWQATTGYSADGQVGFAHVASCLLPDMRKAEVLAGWSTDPKAPEWTGGPVTGMIGPAQEDGVRLVADPPVGGLAANKAPDPSNIPNNHLAYAVQWFLFALAAAVIYLLALRRRSVDGSHVGSIGAGEGAGSGAGSGAGEGAGSGAGNITSY